MNPLPDRHRKRLVPRTTFAAYGWWLRGHRRHGHLGLIFRRLAGSRWREGTLCCQPFDLFGQEPPIRLRHRELGGAFVGGHGVATLPESTQGRASGGVHEVIVVEVARNRVDRGERGGRALTSLTAMARLRATTGVGMTP